MTADPALRIRAAEPADTHALAELWAHVFPGERTAEQRVRLLEDEAAYGGISTAFRAERAGRLAGAFRLYPMRQHLAGAWLPMAGLAGVGVAPGERRRGVGRAMCAEALRIARERGDVVSALYPFRPSFYRALGWAYVGTLHSHRFAPEALPEPDADPGVRLAHARDHDGIAACYARWCAQAHGPIERSAAVWRHLLDAPGTHVYLRDAGDGYLVVRYGRGPTAERRSLHVQELVAENPHAYDALLGWIALQRDFWRRVRYDATPDERFDLVLREPRTPGRRPVRQLWAPVATLARGPMLRIVDVAAALTQRRAWGASGAAFVLELDDDELPDNRGPWLVEVDDSQATVRAATGRERDLVLGTDIGTFTQIWAGELSTTEAVRLKAAAVSGDANALDRLFSVREAFRLLDEF